MKDVPVVIFLYFLEYLYTEHCPIDTLNEKEIMQLIRLASRYHQTRLINLCELYCTKLVDKATVVNIEKSNIDIIGLFLSSQKYSANQLAAFLQHFICTNYEMMSKRSEFKLLTGENLRYIEEHQWPPVSYLKAADEYERQLELRKNSQSNSLMKLFQPFIGSIWSKN